MWFAACLYQETECTASAQVRSLSWLETALRLPHQAGGWSQQRPGWWAPESLGKSDGLRGHTPVSALAESPGFYFGSADL